MGRSISRRLWIAAVSICCISPASAASYREDLARLHELLSRDRSYTIEERAEAEQALSVLERRARRTSRAEFNLAAARIAALARNGHTMVLPGIWAVEFNRTPLRYHVFADGLHVVHAPEKERDLIGARVISIAGYEVDEIGARFAAYFGGRDTKRSEWLVYFAESPALMHAAGLSKSSEFVDVRLELLDGSTSVRRLRAAIDPPKSERFDFLDTSRLVSYATDNVRSPDAVPYYLQGQDRAFAVRALGELDAVYFQLRINKSFYEQKIEAFLDRVRESILRGRPRNLVIDLRLDGGGDLNTTREFFESLPGMLPSDGRIFVLTSGRTFSAGIASAGYVAQAAPGRTTIVGEPIGDFLEYWAEGEFVELPESKAVVLLSTERHNYSTGCSESDCHGSIRSHPIKVESLEPDIVAPLTYADYRRGRDPALEAVRKALLE